MSTISRTIDVAPARATHPRLALLAAVLSLFGVTVAWDLPAGGFWIGIPLAIVAVVLGRNARRAGDRPRMATAALLIGAFAIAFVAICTVVLALT